MKAAAARKLPIMPIAELVATSPEIAAVNRRFDEIKAITALLKAKA